jgi:tetratricopeptide (TPR) repeat protein
MEKSRMQMLEEFIQQRPGDAFARYGLAMEYVNAGRHEDALATFDKLLEFKPNYTAAYYQAGALLGKLNRAEEAREMLQAGMDVAAKNGDFHSRGEMEEALHNLPA